MAGKVPGMDDHPIFLHLDKLLVAQDAALRGQLQILACKPCRNDFLPLLQKFRRLLDVLVLAVKQRAFLTHSAVRLDLQCVIGIFWFLRSAQKHDEALPALDAVIVPFAGAVISDTMVKHPSLFDTQVYAHILDEDRKVNAQKFEMAFYANADLRGVEQRLRAESAAAEPDSEILLKQLEAKPELMDAFTKKFVEQYGEQIMNQLAKKLIGA